MPQMAVAALPALFAALQAGGSALLPSLAAGATGAGAAATAAGTTGGGAGILASIFGPELLAAMPALGSLVEPAAAATAPSLGATLAGIGKAGLSDVLKGAGSAGIESLFAPPRRSAMMPSGELPEVPPLTFTRTPAFQSTRQEDQQILRRLLGYE